MFIPDFPGKILTIIEYDTGMALLFQPETQQGGYILIIINNRDFHVFPTLVCNICIENPLSNNSQSSIPATLSRSLHLIFHQARHCFVVIDFQKYTAYTGFGF